MIFKNCNSLASKPIGTTKFPVFRSDGYKLRLNKSTAFTNGKMVKSTHWKLLGSQLQFMVLNEEKALIYSDVSFEN